MSEDFKAEIERLRAENESLKNKKSTDGSLSMKVSEKGALSIYGMGRFPVTLYKEQWLKLLGIADQIKKYIEENNSRLKTKESITPLPSLAALLGSENVVVQHAAAGILGDIATRMWWSTSARFSWPCAARLHPIRSRLGTGEGTTIARRSKS